MKHVVLGIALAVMSVAVHAQAQQVVRSTENTAQDLQPKIDPPVSTPATVNEGNDSLAVPATPRFPDGLDEADALDLPMTMPRFYTVVRPPARSGVIPRTRWQHMKGHEVWTRAALSALKKHGKPLVDLVPGDIEAWCPAYPTGSDHDRRAFWVGFLSALSKHESTYKPWAVGGGGRWYGLLQILPGTARGYKCNVGTGEALKNGAANLSCAVRIMAVTVPRDGVIYGPGGRGVAADWGPLRSAAKRRDMAGWLRRQNYCKPLDATRPKVRP